MQGGWVSGLRLKGWWFEEVERVSVFSVQGSGFEVSGWGKDSQLPKGFRIEASGFGVYE